MTADVTESEIVGHNKHDVRTLGNSKVANNSRQRDRCDDDLYKAYLNVGIGGGEYPSEVAFSGMESKKNWSRCWWYCL